MEPGEHPREGHPAPPRPWDRPRVRVAAAVAAAVLLVAGVVVWQRAADDGDGDRVPAGQAAGDSTTTSPAHDVPATHAPSTSAAADPATTAPPADPPPTTARGASNVALCDATDPPAGSDVAVRVDGRSRFQTMDGFGTTVRLFDDPHLTETFDPETKRSAVVIPSAEQDAILDRLYRDLRLTRVRPATDAGVERVNDNADPGVTDLSAFDFSWKGNDDHVAYFKRAQRRGATDVFLSPVNLEKWMSPADPAEYTEWAMAILRRWKAQGVDMPYYSVVNEPGGANGISGEFIRDVIKLMGPQLRAEGFSTRLMVPDDINPVEAYQRLSVVLADPVARGYVGAVAYHLYGQPGPKAEILRLASQYGLPVWMTEFFQDGALDWANTVHELIDSYGVSAVDYLWGFFGQWTGDGDQLITVRYAGNRYLGYTLEKQYYTFGQFTRFVERGSVRVGTATSDASVRASAFVEDGRTTVVVINNGDAPRQAGFAMAGLPCRGTATGVRTSGTEDWADVPAAAVDGGRFTAALPPRSVTTFVIPPG